MDARSAATNAPPSDAHAFYQQLYRNHLVALWNVNGSLLPKEPRSRCVPHLWRRETMLPLVRRAAEVGGGARRLGWLLPRPGARPSS